MAGALTWAATALFAFLAYTILDSLLTIHRKIRVARATGLRYIVRPCKEYNYLYILLQPLLQRLLHYIPLSLDPHGYRDLFKQDWRFLQRATVHSRYGGVYWNISPGGMNLEVGDAGVYRQILGNREGWQQDLSVLESIALYGPNIIACDESNWKRHRRVLGAEFTEGVNEFVWRHAGGMAGEMMAGWDTSEHPRPCTPGRNTELLDLRALALRVVAGAAFEIRVPFSTATVKKGDGELVRAARFSDALSEVLANIITFMIFPRWLLNLIPGRGKQLVKSYDFVGSYMRQMLLRKQVVTTRETTEDRTLLRGLVNSIIPAGTMPGMKELTFEEVTGNIFLLGLAGSETTANTIFHALVFLALYPEEQDYVLEELDAAREKYAEEWEYKTVFPKLMRLQNLMHETLRLLPTTPMQTRLNHTPQTLIYNSHSITIPAGTSAVTNLAALHVNPTYWGDDALVFDPRRWEEKTPEEGAFAAFGFGPHGCLGRRFSEVEFVAVVGEVLREHRVELARVGGETGEEARERVRREVEEAYSYLTLHVQGDVPLRFVKR